MDLERCAIGAGQERRFICRAEDRIEKDLTQRTQRTTRTQRTQREHRENIENIVKSEENHRSEDRPLPRREEKRRQAAELQGDSSEE
jgi:hypothetical protein